MKKHFVPILAMACLVVPATAQEVAWHVEGEALTADNCTVGCPCIFGEAPSHGHCTFVGLFKTTAGTYGEVDLAGAEFALAGEFVREGHQDPQDYRYVAYYVDEGASPAQRAALESILTGPAFAGLGEPAEVIAQPIDFWGLEGFGTVGASYGGSVGELARLEVSPISGAREGEPLVVENSLEPLFHWTCLGEAQGSYRSANGEKTFTFEGTSGESHRFAFGNDG